MDSAGQEREDKKEREADTGYSAAASRRFFLTKKRPPGGKRTAWKGKDAGRGMACWLLSGEGEGYGFLPCKR